MPTAFNADTGDLRILDNSGQWVAPKRAKNPQSGEELYLDGQEWKPVPLTNPELGAGRAASVLQGATAGFGDELVAGLENPLHALGSITESLSHVPGGSFTSKEGAAGYDKSLQQFRDIERKYATSRPGEAIALNLAGGVPTALATGGAGLARTAATTGGRLAQAGATGAAYGGAYGFGSGEGGTANRVGSAATGAAVGGTVGVGLQLLSPLAQPIYRAIQSRTGPRVWNTRTSTLTTEGRQMVIRAGGDPDAVTRELAEAFAAETRLAANPTEALALSEARSLPVRVDMPRPYVTGDPTAQIRWDKALQGSRGQRAREIAEGAENTMRRQLFANLDAVQGEIAAGGRQVGRGEGMAQASRAVNRRAETFSRRVDNLYNQARQSGDAGIERGAWLQGIQDVRNAVTGDFNPRNIPKVWTTLDDVFGLANRSGDQTPLVSKLFQARRELTALQREGGVEAAAASRAKAAVDRWLTTTGRQNLQGDPQVINRWYRAIAARREYGKKYGSGIVADLIEKDPQAGWRLVIDPQEAATRILGDGSKALNTKGDLFRNLAQLRNRLGQDSESWRGVRQEIFLRLAREARGGLRSDGDYQFSAPKFVKAFDDFMEKNPRLARMLFDEREMNIMRQFRTVANRTIVKPGGRQLGSAAAIQDTVAQIFPFLSRGIKMVAEIPGVKGTLQTPYAAAASSDAAGTIAQRRFGYGVRNVLAGPSAYQATRD